LKGADGNLDAGVESNVAVKIEFEKEGLTLPLTWVLMLVHRFIKSLNKKQAKRQVSFVKWLVRSFES
jgi:hypothetical protein